MIKRDPQAPSSTGREVDDGGFLDDFSEEAPLPELPGFEVLRRLDSGGQGAVYSAYQISTERRVAIKVLRESSGSTKLKEERLRREARFLSRLHHPNIITIHDIGTANNQVYLVTDFIDGVPIDDHVNLAAANVREIVELIVKVCDAMAVAHASGVIHRDLKPQNIVVDDNNQPYVLDFGLAQSLEENLPRLSETDAVVGTVEYLPPERIMGHHPDTRSDVYALGLILYECLADRLPFEGENRAAMLHAIVYDEPVPLRRAAAGEKLNPNTTPAHLSRDLESVVMKAIARDVTDRYQSAADLAADLQRFLNDEPVLARSTSTGYMLRRVLRRYRIHVSAAAVILVVLVGSLLAVTTALKRTEQAYSDTLLALEMAGLMQSGEDERVGGRTESAVESYRAAIALCRNADTSSSDVRERLMAAHSKLATLYYDQNKLEEGRPHADRAIEIAFADTPYADTPEWRIRRAYAINIRGRTAWLEGAYESAARDFLLAADMLAEFGRHYAEAVARISAGKALAKAGRTEDAFAQYKRATTAFERADAVEALGYYGSIAYSTAQGETAGWYHRRKTLEDVERAVNLYRSAIERVEALDGAQCDRNALDLLDGLRTNLDKAEHLLSRLRS